MSKCKFEDIEGFENLKTSKPSIPSFCILRIYLLIFREIDSFTNFYGLFVGGTKYVRGKSVENSDKIVSDSEEFSQTELREHNRR